MNSPSERADMGALARALRVLAHGLETLIEDANPVVAQRVRKQLNEAKRLTSAMLSDASAPGASGDGTPSTHEAGPSSSGGADEGKGRGRTSDR